MMHHVAETQRISYRKRPYECSSEAATLKFPKLPHTPKLGKLFSKLSFGLIREGQIVIYVITSRLGMHIQF